jgi:hypothetical protein
MNFRGNEFPATPFKPPGTDLATKALLLLIIMLAAALAVVLVLIARR